LLKYKFSLDLGALKNTSKMKQLAQRICGRSKGLVTLTMGASATVCSKSDIKAFFWLAWKLHWVFFLNYQGNRQPFSIRFISDHWENAGMMAEISKPGNGFRLTYILQPCSST